MHRPRIEGQLLMINHDVSFRRRFLLSQLAVQRAARNAERLRRPAEITARPADRRLQRLRPVSALSWRGASTAMDCGRSSG